MNNNKKKDKRKKRIILVDIFNTIIFIFGNKQLNNTVQPQGERKRVDNTTSIDVIV